MYFALATVIGLFGGIFFENLTSVKYIATATLEPHFDSARQLYSNVEYLNDLATQKLKYLTTDFIGEESVCVGSISDEKNDKLYYFVIENKNIINNGDFFIGSPKNLINKPIIINLPPLPRIDAIIKIGRLI